MLSKCLRLRRAGRGGTFKLGVAPHVACKTSRYACLVSSFTPAAASVCACVSPLWRSSLSFSRCASSDMQEIFERVISAYEASKKRDNDQTGYRLPRAAHTCMFCVLLIVCRQ